MNENGEVWEIVVIRVQVSEVGDCFVAFVRGWMVEGRRVICDVWKDTEIWNRKSFGPSMGFCGQSRENEVYRWWTWWGSKECEMRVVFI